MGFMDRIEDLKDRFFGGGEEYYDDYEDEYLDDEYAEEDELLEEEPSSRVRSTSLVDARGRGERQGQGLLGNSSRPEAESVSVYTRSGERVSSQVSPSTGGYTSPSSFADASFEGSSARPTVAPMASALPPTVLRPAAYNDIQSIIRRIRTPQAVVLDLRRTPMDEARRILDFSYGLACGVEGTVDMLDERVFCVLPRGIKLSDADLERLFRENRFRR